MIVKILQIDETAINDFLKTPNIKIATKHVTQDKVLIFYETATDDALARDRLLMEQDDALEKLIDIAKEVRQDKTYAGLKNASQREIYVRAKFYQLASDAATVVELLKPEMASILGE